MKFVEKCAWFVCCLFIIIINNQEQVESRSSYLKNFGYKVSEKYFEKNFAKVFENFIENIQNDQKVRLEKELEMKRNRIFQKHLASRISGSFMKDFYGRW
jgi:spore coat polysaccharide biosynthesis predicted glycosyltransferase SpsG